MKSMTKIFTLGVILSGLFFYLGKMSQTNNPSVGEGKINTQNFHSSSNRKFASTAAPSSEIIALNNIIFSVSSYEDVKNKAILLDKMATETIEKIGEDHEDYPAVAMYQSLAQLIPHLEGILWQLGGIAIQSEYVYYSIIGALTDIGYNNFMYSKPVDHFFEYLVRPNESSKRITKVSELQDLLMTKFLPLLEKKHLPKFEKILAKYPGWNEFGFQYDRALVSGGIDFQSPEAVDESFSSEGDRYATFTRSYLASAMGYAKNSMALMYLFCSYDLDDVSNLLNLAFYEAVTKVKLKGLFTDWIKSRRSNIKLNTHKDYANYLKRYPKFLTLLEDGAWSNSEKRDGQAYKKRALDLFNEANSHDLDYITQIHEQAQMPNQDNYIVNATEMIAYPNYSIAHYEKMGKILAGAQVITDSATGKSVVLDIPKLFDSSLNKDLKTYFANGFDYQERKNFLTKVDKKDTFIYTYGRPNAWPDPTFNGLLPEANNSNLREMYRRLMYNNDVSTVASLIFTYIL